MHRCARYLFSAMAPLDCECLAGGASIGACLNSSGPWGAAMVLSFLQVSWRQKVMGKSATAVREASVPLSESLLGLFCRLAYFKR
jgi:hypothetical protein